MEVDNDQAEAEAVDVEPVETDEEVDETEVDETEVEESEESGDDDEGEADEGEETEEEESEESGESDDSLVDIELDGKEYTVPKEIADSIMKSRDYTQKTQEVSERRKRLDSDVEQFEKSTQLYNQNIQLVAKLTNVAERIAEYDNVDWARLTQDDPALAQKHQVTLGNLERERDKLAKELEQKRKQALTEQDAQYRQRNQQARQQLENEIKGYSHEVHGKQAMEAANSLGFSTQFIKALNTGMFPDAVPMIKTLLAAAELNGIKAKVQKAKKPEPKKVVVNKKVTRKGKRFNPYSKNLTPEQRIKYWENQGKK